MEARRANFRGAAVALWWVVPLSALLLIAYVAARATGTDIAAFTHDANALRRLPFYAGLLSNVGVMLWAATAGVCLFCAAVQGRGQRAFFLLGGLLTAVLLLDDLFMLHGEVFDAVLGVPEPLTYATYVAAAAGYLLAFRRKILSTAFVPLAASLALFGVSVVCDVAFPQHELLEDGCKLLGIGCWSAYFVTTGIAHVRAGALATKLSSLELADETQLQDAATALAAMADFVRAAAAAECQRDQNATRLSDVAGVTVARRFPSKTAR
jgi:hypothetical protein